MDETTTIRAWENTMFKGIQQIIKKSNDKDVAMHDPNLLPIETAEALFDEAKRAETIAQYRQLLSFSEEYYARYAAPLLNEFAEFVQSLPETQNGHYALKGGILDHVLIRTRLAMSLLRNYFLPPGEETSTLTQPQSLWAYVVFSAGLLQGIGKVMLDLEVTLFDKQGERLKLWNPLEGAMRDHAHYYQYDFLTAYPDPYRNRCTLLLARQLMPEAGFRWIASDKEILSIWLALLDEDMFGSKTLGPLIRKADALSIQEYLDKLNLVESFKGDFGKHAQVKTTFAPVEKSPIGERSHLPAGEIFLERLRRLVETHKTSLDLGIHAVPGGLLIDPAFFETNKLLPQYLNWQAIQTSLNGLGYIRRGPQNMIFERYISVVNPKHSVQGVVLKNPDLVLPKGEHAKALAKHDYVRATEFKQDSKPYITPTGKFVERPPAKPTVTPTPRSKK